MPPGPTPRESVARDLEAELAAERASTDHWRRVARQRADAYAALRHRRSVRTLLGVERRLAPLRRPLAAARDRVGADLDRWTLAAAAATRRPAADARRDLADLAAGIRGLDRPVRDGRCVTLVVVTSAPSDRVPRFLGDASSEVEPVVVAASTDTVGAIRRAFDASDSELLAIALATSEPLDDAWLARLVGAVSGDVVAATSVLVHPARRRDHATPDDGRVRSAGLALEIDPRGVPVVAARDAGDPPDPRAPATDAFASAAGVVIDRAAYQRAGGLPYSDDLDVAVVELGARLTAAGGRAVVVPGSVLVDHRPVTSRAALRTPVDPDGPAWRTAVDRAGAALWRAARPSADPALRIAVTVAAPSAKLAPRWGDTHLAEGLAAALRRTGHDVSISPASESEDLALRSRDVHLVLRGLEPIRRSRGQRHVLWIISHPESIEDDELDDADLVLVASTPFAAHLRTRTSTPVAVFLQATDQHRFRPMPVDPAHRHPVTVVAKTRDVLRPIVADAIAVGLRPSIYGGGWERLVDPALVVADHVDNATLPRVYSSAGVVLNDHWRTMQAWGFVSNRLFDVLACATPVVSDPVGGIADLFSGTVLEYHTPDDLRRLVDGVLADPDAAKVRAERGRQMVLAAHTFDHRAAQFITLLDRYTGNARL
jgi:Glycosyl transferases group 1